MYYIYYRHERLQQHGSLRVAVRVVVAGDTPIEDAEKVGRINVLFLSNLARELAGAFFRFEVGNDLREKDKEGGSGSGGR